MLFFLYFKILYQLLISLIKEYFHHIHIHIVNGSYLLDSAVQPMSDGSSSVAALTQSVIRSAKDPIAARQYIVSEIEKKKVLRNTCCIFLYDGFYRLFCCSYLTVLYIRNS